MTGVTGSGKSALIAGISKETSNTDHHAGLGHANTTEVLQVSRNFGKHITL